MKKLVIGLFAITAVTGSVQAQVKTAATKTKNTPVVPMKNLMDSFSYAVGVNIAHNMKDQGINDIKFDLMVKAMQDVFKGNTTILNSEQCNGALQTQMGIFSKMKEEETKKQASAEKAKGEAFLANNKTRKEVITLPNGMQYEILKSGDAQGIKPTVQDTVVVDYVGTLTNGTQFDASTGRGPATFMLGQVIKGWQEILQLMRKGDKWKVYIPSDLGYGDMGNGPKIPGGSTLVFEIDLLDIKTAVVK